MLYNKIGIEPDLKTARAGRQARIKLKELPIRLKLVFEPVKGGSFQAEVITDEMIHAMGWLETPFHRLIVKIRCDSAQPGESCDRPSRVDWESITSRCPAVGRASKGSTKRVRIVE
jgi:hypothetical protein